jgi:Uma2 family endonuclease
LEPDESEPEPDVAIVPNRSYAGSHPASAFLIVEVAESSLTYGRETKAPLYAASDVAEYWIVDVTGRAIEVFREPANGRYTSVRRAGLDESLSPGAFPDVVVSVSALFA